MEKKKEEIVLCFSRSEIKLLLEGVAYLLNPWETDSPPKFCRKVAKMIIRKLGERQ
jgi:hypothetical protein